MGIGRVLKWAFLISALVCLVLMNVMRHLEDTSTLSTFPSSEEVNLEQSLEDVGGQARGTPPEVPQFLKAATPKELPAALRARPRPKAASATKPNDVVAEARPSSLETAERAEPARRSLKPLGYVERRAGEVEAIVAEGESVYVVHEGDVFADKYQVVSISPQSVEVAEVAEDSASRLTVAEQKQPDLLPSVREQGQESRERGAARLFAERTSPPTPEPKPLGPQTASSGALKPLGYVERRDGTMAAILDTEAGIQIVRPGDRYGERFRVADVSPNAVAIREEIGKRGDLSLVAARDPGLAPAASEGRKQSASPNQAILPAEESPQTAAADGINVSSNLPPPDETRRQAIAYVPFARAKEAQVFSSPADMPVSVAKAIGSITWADGETSTIVSRGSEIAFLEGCRAPPLSQAVSFVTPVGAAAHGPPGAGELPICPEFESGGNASLARVLPLAAPRLVSGPLGRLDTCFCGDTPEGALGRHTLASSPLTEPEGHEQQQNSTNLLRAAAPEVRVRPAPPGQRPGIALRPIGYVDWGGGRVVAVVDYDDQIYLVREGSVLAGTFRAVRVSPTLVEAVFDPPQQLGRAMLASLESSTTTAEERTDGLHRELPADKDAGSFAGTSSGGSYLEGRVP